MTWEVHKFGGTSLADSSRYRNCAHIVLNNVPLAKQKCVVVSAMGAYKADLSALVDPTNLKGIKNDTDTIMAQKEQKDKVTSILIKIHELASQRDVSYLPMLQELKERHMDLVTDLLDFDRSQMSPKNDKYNVQVQQELKDALEKDFEDLSFILRGSWLGRSFDAEHWVHGYGEVWSARLMCAFINFVSHNDLNDEKKNKNGKERRAVFLDAREVVFTIKDRSSPTPDITRSTQKMKEWLAQDNREDYEFVVVTGYIASDWQGKPVTLGRDGSDYSASIMGALLKSDSVTIWTDVDGVYSANPNIIANPVVRDELTYSEASELAYFGAKVIHPKTMTPVIRDEIPIWLRNTFNTENKGTVIQAEKAMSADQKCLYGVKGFSCIDNLSLLCVEGTGMIGVPGIAHRLFGALKAVGVNVELISQAGSEHSICLAVPAKDGAKGLAAIHREFRDEEEDGYIQRVDQRGPCACLAIVGEGMKSTPGVAGRLCSALAESKINIMAIAQGSSERNISVIIQQADAMDGLRAAHAAFVGTDPEERAAFLRKRIAAEQAELDELEKKASSNKRKKV